MTSKDDNKFLSIYKLKQPTKPPTWQASGEIMDLLQNLREHMDTNRVSTSHDIVTNHM